MDALLTAFIGDLTSRSLSFLIDKCLNKAEPTKEERLDSLQRLLLRVRVVVEEAGEHVTNQAMLQQLSSLRNDMYRGYFTLDATRCRANDRDNHDDHKSEDGDRRRSFALSRFNRAKRILFSDAGSSSSDDLQKVLWRLETSIADVNECIVLLSTCPRLRQPYSMHLILDKCMFGRQMELQHIVNFLLQTGCCDEPGVLPIIGPGRVGKSTLVEHACNDERVRDHFSQIIFFTQNDIIAGESNNLICRDGRGGGVVKHRNNCHLEGAERMLIIIELDGDRLTENLDKEDIEVLWGRLYSAYKNSIPRGSKMIVTSRSGEIARFGTMPPMRLRFFSREAYWYFFKVLAFGAMDAAEHPRLASIAMEMAAELNGCFLSANMLAGILRSNVDAGFWRIALTTLREFNRVNHEMTTPEPYQWGLYSDVHIPTMSEHVVVLDDYQLTGSTSEAPRVMAVDVLFGHARPRGKFDVLKLRSHLPPHYSYVLKCEIRRTKQHVVARKRRTP